MGGKKKLHITDINSCNLLHLVFEMLTLLSCLVSSAHTDCIVTEDPEVAELFLRQVDR